MSRRLRVALLAGGRSSEHDISLLSARSVLEALDPDRYEVRVAALSVDPAKIQVEVSGQRLALRMPEKLGGMLQRSFSFSDAIDGEASSAKWSEGTLIITLPKKKGRRISLKDS